MSDMPNWKHSQVLDTLILPQVSSARSALSSGLGLTLENSPQYKIKAPYLDCGFTTGGLTHVSFSDVNKKRN